MNSEIVKSLSALHFQTIRFDSLSEKNPLLADFNREHKNFQFLTNYADTLLRQFSDDAIRIFGDSEDYKDFRLKFVAEFEVPN